MKEYLQYIRKFIWSSVKPSARKWFWVIVVAAALAFLVLFGILRYKMKFSVADSGYIGWLFTVRAVLIALISTAAIILTVLVTVGTAIYKRDKRLAAEQAKEAESAVAKKTDGELPAIDAKMLEPYFTAKYKGIGSNYKQFEFLIVKLENERHNSAATIGKIAFILYNSSAMSSNKPRSFKKWLDIFFTALGLEPPKDKNKNKYAIDTRNDRDMALKNKYEPMT